MLLAAGLRRTSVSASVYSFLLTFSAFFLFSGAAQSFQGPVTRSEVKAYYGQEFYEMITRPTPGISERLKDTLNKIKNGVHIQQDGDFDEIDSSCRSRRGCYQHQVIGYRRARIFLLGEFYLVQDGKDYGVQDVYCNKVYTKQDFGKGGAPGPMKIPDNTIVNVEHTWPQSKFTSQYSKEEQKSDLHHLYPTDSQLNSIRGNNPFGEVARDKMNLKCDSGARFGVSGNSGEEMFEPPQDHKGNVARALFYFSVKYNMPISNTQEQFLRQWHEEDPVDEEEMLRNEEIFKLQGSLNVFIDHPEIVNLISDF